MILIDQVAVSDDLASEMFACDIARCKGACCVEGDSGAPLEPAELEQLETLYEAYKPYLRPEGIAALEEQGLWLHEPDGTLSTPLVNGAECAYAVFDDKGVALCGIEQAWFDGKIGFRKPISCHLYPIRIQQMGDFEALNYHRWDICGVACHKGKQEGVRVYEFLREAIIRKYGEEFYEMLDFTIREQGLR